MGSLRTNTLWSLFSERHIHGVDDKVRLLFW
jgi:hypothetical protein